MSKFKYGDIVTVGKNIAKVISVFKKGDATMCRVRFKNKNLMPREMEYLEWQLSFEKEHPFCPICESSWNITKFNMQEWKDCLKCNKKMEDLIEEYEDSKKIFWHDNWD